MSSDTVAALEQRIASLEAELKSTREDVSILKSAVSFLSMRSESHDASGGGAKKPYASQTLRLPPKSTPNHGDHSPSEKSSPVKSASPSPAPRPPTATRTPTTVPKPSTPAKENPDLKRYGTLPKNFNNQQAAKSPAPAGDHDEKKGTPVPKVLQARTPSKDSLSGADDIDASRKGHYTVNGKKIFYVLPPDMSVKEAKAADPRVELQLQHAYGYNGRAARDNLFFSHDKQEIIYCLAGAGVVMNINTGEQRFFTGHSEDILCLAVHPTRTMVATGQLDPKGASTPYICVWDYSNMQLVRKIVFHDRGVGCVAFSPDGKYLASIGHDDSHTLALWDWENAGQSADQVTASASAPESKTSKKPAQDTPLIERMSSKEDVFAIVFNPQPSADEEDKKDDFGQVDLEFVTVGVKVLKLWQVGSPDNKDKKQRKIRDRIPSTLEVTKITQKAYHCVAFADNGEFWVGCQSGHTYKFKGSKITKFVQAHEAEKIVGVIRKTDNGYASVGDDGKLKLWDEDFKSSEDVDLSGHSAGEVTKVRAMDYADGKLVLGLKSNEILMVDIKSKAITVVVEGHHSDVWGLAVHPSAPIVATGAHDKTIRVWDYSAHRAADKKVIKCSDKVRSVIFTPDGSHLAAGLWNGKLALYAFPSLDLVWEKKVSLGETIDALAVSPDSSLLAVGSWDQIIYVLQMPSGKVLQTLKGHTSSVLMVDFSDDGKFLMSNSKDYEILYWDIIKGKRLNNVKEIADLKWYGWHCFLGWPVQGIWAETGDGTDINAVCRSNQHGLLATGDDFGRVRVYKYPVMAKDAPAKVGIGHCSHVTNVAFSGDDGFLFSAGGADTALFQWKIVSA